ncbi:MAG: IS1634 family transposase [Bacteroidales bacterium]|jgi:hypothetical protein|nr:IS1634 family transposase [Bacteroidales bacterium]
MFIRKKKNRSGTTSIVVVNKIKGCFQELKTIGVSSNEKELATLYEQGKRWIEMHCGNRDMFLESERQREEKQVTEYFLNNVENILLNGTQLILNEVFRLVGFDAINDDILRHLVVARLCQPASKSGTVDYLKSYFDEDVELHKIYRYLDRLHNTLQDKIQQISVEHTLRILGGHIGLVFYDVTTLYFESDNSDELRERGFSKDGKHSQPQVVLGLLVSRDGYPLSYSLFNGSQYEGRTMIPVVEDFVHRFQLDDFVIVADSGLMTKTNMALLESANYKYIIGARIKNETEEIKQWILSLDKKEGRFYELDAKQVYEQYRGLWVIERAYRVTKGTLEMRLMFHFTQKRIEAHVCVCFVAYKIYKELERILKLSNINLSVDKVLNIAKTINTLKAKLPASGETLTKTMLMTQNTGRLSRCSIRIFSGFINPTQIIPQSQSSPFSSHPCKHERFRGQSRQSGSNFPICRGQIQP